MKLRSSLCRCMKQHLASVVLTEMFTVALLVILMLIVGCLVLVLSGQGGGVSEEVGWESSYLKLSCMHVWNS